MCVGPDDDGWMGRAAEGRRRPGRDVATGGRASQGWPEVGPTLGGRHGLGTNGRGCRSDGGSGDGDEGG